MSEKGAPRVSPLTALSAKERQPPPKGRWQVSWTQVSGAAGLWLGSSDGTYRVAHPSSRGQVLALCLAAADDRREGFAVGTHTSPPHPTRQPELGLGHTLGRMKGPGTLGAAPHLDPDVAQAALLWVLSGILSQWSVTAPSALRGQQGHALSGHQAGPFQIQASSGSWVCDHLSVIPLVIPE